MLSLWGLLPVSLLLTVVSSSAIAQSPEQLKASRETQADLEEFERLLDQVDPPSLHAALHDYSPKKFTHGMFEKDRTAAEALHKEDASIASSIVALAKRQANGNGTVTTSTPPVVEPGSTSTPEVPDSPSPSTRVTPEAPITTGTATLPGGGVVTETPSEGATTVLSTSTSPLAPGASSTAANAAASPSNSNAALTTPAPSAAGNTGPLTAGEVLTSTDAQGSVILNTLSDGEVITSVNAEGVTIVTTVGGGSQTIGPGEESGSASVTGKSKTTPHTATTKKTTTLPDGSKSTVTAVTVVDASGIDTAVPSGTAGVGAASGTAAGAPGLQTGFAPKSVGFGGQMLAVVGGAVGVAMMM